MKQLAFIVCIILLLLHKRKEFSIDLKAGANIFNEPSF